MPTIYQLKPAFQQLLRPTVGALVRLGVTANQVTVAAVVLSAVAGGCVFAWPEARWPLLVLPAALFVRMALNAIDGIMACEHGMSTRLGAVLNEMGDVVSDTLLYLPLARVAGFDELLVAGAVVLGVMTEMAGVVAVQIGASRRYDGPMGKSDRAFVFGALGLLLGLGVPSGPWLSWVLAAVCALSVATVVRRARFAIEEVGK